MQGNPKQSWILDSTLWAPDSLSVEIGYWIPIFIGISDSLSCIQGIKALDSGLHSKNFLDSVFHKQGDDTQALIT